MPDEKNQRPVDECVINWDREYQDIMDQIMSLNWRINRTNRNVKIAVCIAVLSAVLSVVLQFVL